MKLRIRCKKTTKVFVVSEERNELTTLSEIREVASQLFDISNFQLSLNNSEVLEDETKTLLDYGVVGGDLIYVVLESDGSSPASGSSSQTSLLNQLSPCPASEDSLKPSKSDQPGTSQQSHDEHEQMETSNKSAQTGTGTHLHMDTGNKTVAVTAENQSVEAGSQSQIPDCDPVDYKVVNRCLQEPVLCRDSSETSVPSLLQEVHAAASPQDTVEALSVVLHVLMLETGYVTCPQPESCPPVLPSIWRQPGYTKFEYTYPGCQEITCSVTAISAGPTVIVHGKVTGDHSVTRQCTLKPKDFVMEPVSEVTHCYCNLARLSMVFKDSIANPLVSDMRIAAGIEDIYGLLALNQEVKLQIQSYLDVKSFLRLSGVNKEMYNLSRDPYLWRRLYLRDFGNRKDNFLSQDWRKLYIQEYKSRKERKKLMSRMTLVTPPTWGPPNNPFAGPSNWIPPGPGMIGGDYDLFPNFPGGLPGIPGRMGPRQPMMPRPRYDLIGPNPDHEPDIPGMAPLGPRGPSLGGRGRGNPFGGGFGPRFF